MPTTLPAKAARNDQPMTRSVTARIDSSEECHCHAYHALEKTSAAARNRAPIAQPQESPALRQAIPAGSLERLDRKLSMRPRPVRTHVIPWISLPGTVGHFVSGFFPGIRAVNHERRLAEPFADILYCLTDSGAVVGSGAVKDDFLIFRQSGTFRFRPGQRDRSLPLHLPACFFVTISTDQKGLSGCRPLEGFPGRSLHLIRHPGPWG
jgi:hypothetical protein